MMKTACFAFGVVFLLLSACRGGPMSMTGVPDADGGGATEEPNEARGERTCNQPICAEDEVQEFRAVFNPHSPEDFECTSWSCVKKKDSGAGADDPADAGDAADAADAADAEAGDAG